MLGWTVDHTTRDSIVLARQNLVQWVSRVPAGEYLYRIETTSPGALVAGRSSATLVLGADTTTGFALRGFGVSDLLLATRAEPAGVPRRWHDFALTPVLGSVQRGTDVSLVWEVYEAGMEDNRARYGVTVTLTRERSAAGRVAMSIVGAITGAVGRRRGDDGVDITFERVVPHAPALVDHVTVSLEDTPPGAYRIAIAVTDRVTGRVTTRGTRIVVQ
jgi:hypothetical protein